MNTIKHSMKQKIIRNKKLVIFLVGLALFGIVSGSIFLTFIDALDQELVKDYITSFTTSIEESSLNYKDIFMSSITSEMVFAFLLFVLGFSIVGIPVCIVLYFIKSFMIGFSISSFIFTLKVKGTVFSLFYMIPYLCNFFFYTFFLIYAIRLSLSLFKLLFSKEEISLKRQMRQYLFFFCLLLLLLCVTSLIETFVVPFLLNLIF